MKVGRRLTAGLAAVTALSLTVAGLGANTVSQAQTSGQVPVAGGTLNIGMPGDALTLDPMLTTDEYSKPVESLIYNSLVKLGPKGDIQPDLATTWHVSQDGLTYTFNLRKNVYFHDGTRMTATDVAFSFQRIMSKSLASPWGSFFQTVQTVKALNPSTVQVTLSKADAPFLAVIASFLYVMNPTFVQAHQGNLKRVEDGTGPYKLGKWVANESITLVKNTRYFIPNHPYLQSIVFQIIPQDTSRIAALQSGQVQFAEFTDPSQYAQLNSLGSGHVIQAQKFLDSNYHMFGFNTKRAPFNNAKVRLALSYALDRQALVDGPGFREGMVTGILTQALNRWAIPTSKYPSYQSNIAKAKQLLREAGYAKGFSFSIMAPPTFPIDMSSAVMIQSQLKQIGVNAKVVPTEWGTYVNNWVKRNFDSFTGENGDWTDPDLAMYAALHTGGSTNAFQYSNASVDRLLEQGRTTMSFTKRHQIYAQLQQLVVEQAPMIDTFASYDLIGMSPKLHGYVHVSGDDYRTLSDVWIK